MVLVGTAVVLMALNLGIPFMLVGNVESKVVKQMQIYTPPTSFDAGPNTLNIRMLRRSVPWSAAPVQEMAYINAPSVNTLLQTFLTYKGPWEVSATDSEIKVIGGPLKVDVSPAEFDGPGVYNEVHISDGAIKTMKCGYAYCSLNKGKTASFEVGAEAEQSIYSMTMFLHVM